MNGIDGKRLAELLAPVLDAIVPEGFGVQEREGQLVYTLTASGFWGGTPGSYVEENLENGDTVEERVSNCAAIVLDQLQDYVDEEFTQPWPGEHTPPKAQAGVVDGVLYMWFGDESIPVLTCPPIDLRGGGVL